VNGDVNPLRDQVFCVVDVETCGEQDPEKDAVVEIGAAWCDWTGTVGHVLQAFVDPGRPIPPEASAIHGITDRDVVGAPTIDEVFFNGIAAGAALAPPWDVLVAHNAEFDQARLTPLQSSSAPWLCTKRLAQHLLPDRVNHRNQTLRYLFGGADVIDGVGHRALDDCRVTAFNLGNLIRLYLEAGNPDDLGALVTFAAEPIAVRLWPFGPDYGKPITESDWGLVQWALKTDRVKNDPDLLKTLRDDVARRSRERNAERETFL